MIVVKALIFILSLQFIALSSSKRLSISVKKLISPIISFTTAISLNFGYLYPSYADSEYPPLDKCFNAIRKEINNGDSLKRLQNDLDTSNWEDIITFTREYDAGFRGGVLKPAWKQLNKGKDEGITISNSFTYDLIGMNKAARVKDKEEASKRLSMIRDDLVQFLDLEKYITKEE